MYFSRVRIDFASLNRRALVQVVKGNAYSHHVLLWKLFPEIEQGGRRPFVFRHEPEGGSSRTPSRRGFPSFYLVSDRPPIDLPGLLEAQTKPYDPRLRVGERLEFRLRANPVVTKKGSGKNSRHHDVVMNAKLAAKEQSLGRTESLRLMDTAARNWMLSPSRIPGAEISKPELRVDGYRPQKLYKSKKPAISLSSIDYEGLLTVTEPERLREALFRGVGRAKAFGCGLLMIRRVHQTIAQ